MNIHDALSFGDFPTIRRIIEKYPKSVHSRDDRKRTLLDVAIAEGKLEIAKYLWIMGGQPNFENYRDGNHTPIHDATYGCTDTLKWILEKKILRRKVLNIKNSNGWTPFDNAISRGNLEIAKYLWEMEGRPNLKIYRDGNYTPVHSNAVYGEPETLKWVLEKTILPLCVLNIKDTWKKTPLDWTIASGNLEAVQFLFEKGGSPNLDIYNRGKDSPVHCAVRRGNITTLMWVLEKNILPLSVLNNENDVKMTPLDYTIAQGNLEMARSLFEKGGRPNLEQYSDGKWTPVHTAANYGYTTTLKWVFTENVVSFDVLKIKDRYGWTPLDCAKDRKRSETIALLRKVCIYPVFLIMQRAKRDYRQCVLRKLPNELLDMIVDEVAARHGLQVVW